MGLALTSMQQGNAGGFRRVAFTKPINDRGKQMQEQVKPLLRLMKQNDLNQIEKNES